MLRMETKGPILEKNFQYIRRLSWNKSTVSGKIITYLGRNTVACFDFKFCRSIAQGEKKDQADIRKCILHQRKWWVIEEVECREP